MKNIIINFIKFFAWESKKSVSEDDYYKDMFVNDSEWNSSEPNLDEQSRWEKIEEFCDLIKLSDSDSLEVIDVGCGRGWLSEKLTKYGSVTGIEPVQSVVDYARTLFSKPSFYCLTPAEFIQLYSRMKFDLVVCSEVIEHVVDKKSFVKDLHKLLRKNGNLIITTPRGELRDFWEKKYSVPPQPIEMWISTNDLIELLNSTGFRLLKSSTAFSDGIYQIHLLEKVEQ